MDVAGLVIAIGATVPLCAQGYNALLGMRGFRKDSTVLFWKLRIQEHRFNSWLQAYGSTLGDMDSSSRYPPLAVLELVHGILSAMQATLLDADKMVTRYGLEKLGLASSGLEASVTTSAFSMLCFKWTIHDKSAFDKLISDLKEFNDGLLATVTPATQKNLEFSADGRIISAADEVDDLLAIQTASSDLSSLKNAASFKAYNLAIHSQDVSGMESRRFEIDFSEVHIDNASDTNARICIGTWRDSNVLVEWKYYNTSEALDPIVQSIERVGRLAQLLSSPSMPENFHTLKCHGFTHDRFSSRIGMIFGLPIFKVTVPEVSRPFGNVSKPWLALSDLITQQPKMPLLGHRITLALSLVKAMVQFHACGWLHKGFEASNILFFYQNIGLGANSFQSSSSHAIDLRLPHIIGFEYSRPSSTIELSDNRTGFWVTREAAYIHPAYLAALRENKELDNSPTASTNRFKAEYDQFSLGCVLLEIGLWRRIIEFWKPEYMVKDPNFWARRLIRKYVVELGGRCGLKYQSAVEDLLTQDGIRGAGNSQTMTNFELVQLLESINT